MKNQIPKHVGIIMDGNRRWAKDNSFNIKKGHQSGAETLKKISLHAFDRGVEYLSVYAFSTENWQRSSDEVKHIMSLIAKGFEKYFDEFNDRNIKILILGGSQNVPLSTKKVLDNAIDRSKNNTGGTLAICFNYGGQDEIVQAVRNIVHQNIEEDNITKDTISKNLFAPEIPPIDIMVRTSGEQRISNFMLWRIAYSELMFINKNWPDFSYTDLDDVINEYQKRNRRYGG